MFTNFSPNMLKTYEKCSQKFYLKYAKKLSMPVDEEIFYVGKNVHALASYYLRGENIDKMEKGLSDIEQKYWKYLKNMKYIGYETMHTEYLLTVKLDDVYFGGRIDALVKDNDKYYILDYKTGKIPDNAVYDFQTMIYLLAVSEFYKTNNVAFVYIDLKRQKEVVIDLTESLKPEYKVRLLKTADMINNLSFRKISDECVCEYKLVCY
ncbi:MAG: PD-(D/E)XK nuclease family protein [bacterium]|nr:PD-(D/E)XK nuclease family protein [bacterium]